MPSPEPASFAFYGLGVMGGPIARKLSGSCGKLIVSDPVAERVEELCRQSECRAAGAGGVAETAFLCLPDQTVVEAVVGQLLQSGTRTIIDFGAHAPDFVLSISEQCRRQGMEYCDAPVFGTPTMAVQGDLYFLFSGPEATYQRFHALAAQAGFRSRYAGRTGAASTVKLLQNALGSINLLAGAEALKVCEQTGIDTEMFNAVVSECGGIGRSVVMDKYASDMALRSDSGDGRIKIAAKDMKAAAELAAKAGTDAVLIRETAKRYQAAQEAGFENDQVSNVIKSL